MLSNNLVNYHANKCFEYASLAQLVEHWSPKPGIEGSSPSGYAIKSLVEILTTFFMYNPAKAE